MHGIATTTFSADRVQEALRSVLDLARQAGFTITYAQDSIILTPPRTPQRPEHSHYGYVCTVPDCTPPTLKR